MNKLASLLAVAIVALLPALARAQPAPAPPTGGEAKAKPDKPDLDAPVPADQLDKARAQTERGLKMAPMALTMQLTLTDAQQESVTKILQDRWSGMAKEDQDKMFRVMIQARQLVESGQGTAEDFQKLARVAQPVVESTLKTINETTADLQKILDEGQKAKLAESMGGFKEAQEGMLARVKQVSDGTAKLQPNGEPEGGWTDELELRKNLRRGGDVQVVEEEIDETGPDGVVRKVKVKRVKSKLPDEETVAGDEKYWAPFLKGYIAKYNLDDDQQKKARKLLGESLTRASALRKPMKQAFEDARKKIKDAEAGATDNPNALEAARLAYNQLNRPVVTIFHEMERKLDDLLAAQQRESGKTRGELFGAAGAPPAKEPPTDPKDKPKDPSSGTDTKVHVIH